MLKAFENIGYEVESIVGYAKEREQKSRSIIEQLERGRQFSFIYSESHTMPTLLTERHHFPTYPFLDFRILARLRGQGIPLGLFYRDVYWRFELYKKVARHKRAIAIPLYWYDWLRYKQTVDHLFIPSLAMKPHLPSPWLKDLTMLPPGADVDAVSSTEPFIKKSHLNLFYVGGVMPPLYDLTPLFEVLHEAEDDVRLTLCCREKEWNEISHCYDLPSSVEIVHSSGKELSDYYARADLFCIIRKPDTYLNFAMPVKIFEAMAYGLPIVISGGGAAAQLIRDEAVGWTVDSKEAFLSLINRLREHPEELERKREHVRSKRHEHTWQARAKQVADTLEKYNK